MESTNLLMEQYRSVTLLSAPHLNGYLETERGFRKVRGYQGMPTLVAAIRGDAEQINRVDHDEAAA